MDSRKTVKPNQLSDELLGNQSLGLLQELHLLTRDGQLNADARRKLKQVNHLYNLLFPALSELSEKNENLTMVDVGAGKAYLGFIIYELFFKNLSQGEIISIESRKDLAQKAKEMAQRLGFSRMTFIDEKIEAVSIPRQIHILTALHACDTATDDAIISGIKAQANYIAVVPCCQAEAAGLLSSLKNPPLSEIWRHGIHRREFGSHITNVFRALVLESVGYQVTVTELVGWEHSMKNEFILAKKVQRENNMAKSKLTELLKSIQIEPKIARYLKNEYI